MRVVVAVTALLLLSWQAACTGDWARKQYDDYRKRTDSLDARTVAEGLKEALSQGTRQGVAALGRANGYLDNPSVHIPLPANLQKAESFVRRFGGARYADQFVVSLNRAAEAAVPQAQAIFLDVIRNMSIEDAIGILKGPPDAATQYLRRQAGARLAAAFRPVVVRTTADVGVTHAYKRFVQEAGSVGLVDARSFDLDAYVTHKTLDGLFYMIAQEEERIRRDPVARTTALLRKVFG
jgi:hypothetical protein